MSLKAFHIVFVCISTLLFAFLAVWAFAFATDRTATITAPAPPVRSALS